MKNVKAHFCGKTLKCNMFFLDLTRTLLAVYDFDAEDAHKLTDYVCLTLFTLRGGVGGVAPTLKHWSISQNQKSC